MIHDIGAWLSAHEAQANLYSTWLLAFALYVLFVVELVSWAVMHYQQPRTLFGRRLKGKKAGTTWLFLGLALLYTASLILYYTYPNTPVGIWARTGIRVFTVGAALFAVMQGARFFSSFREENWGRP